MTTQTRNLVLGLGVMLLIGYSDAIRPFNNFLDVFCWMGYLTVMLTVILWPKTGKDERVQKGDAPPRWANKIDFDTLGPQSR